MAILNNQMVNTLFIPIFHSNESLHPRRHDLGSAKKETSARLRRRGPGSGPAGWGPPVMLVGL